jgi:hypothetical protein
MAVVYVIIALVIVVGFAISLFVRRHGESDRPQPGWRRTDEAFHDPSTGRVMRVWLDEGGERHYVHESDQAAT